MKKVIGIDLGTTNSVVAFKTKDVEVLRNKENEELTRSCVGIRETEILVGRPAFQLLAKDPQNTILSVKRLMGVAYKDEMVQKMIAETQKVRGYYKYAITQLKGGTDDAVAVILGGKQYAPEQISAEILKKLKADAEEREGEVSHAVITVPAYFTEKQKNATKLAAKYAGLKVLKILAEPTAAAIAYGVDNLKAGEAKTVLIYDFGGGTFDLSVLNIVDGQYLEMGTGGDRWLGGDDIDKELTNYIYKQVCSKYNLDIKEIDKLIDNLQIKKKFRFLSDFRQKVEQIKIELSSSQTSDFILEDILEDDNGDTIDINITITRQEFERLIRPYVQRSIDLIDELLKGMSYDIEMIDNILLVGGTSCIPLVKEMLVAKYGSEKIKVSKKPMLAVAEGAAILAHRLDDNYEAEPDVTEGVIDEIAYSTNHNLYVMFRNENGELQPERIIERQMPLPQTSIRKFKTSVDNQKIIKVEIKSDVENGELESGSSIAFLSLDQELPANSELVFEFELSIDETLKVIVYPQGHKNKAKQVPITRGQKDAKAFKVIDDEIKEFNSKGFGLEKQHRFEKIVIDRLKEAEQIGLENSLDERWAKISYETQEAADRIKSEPEQQGQRDNSILAKILIGNYSMLIPDSDLNKMRKLIEIIENEDDDLKISQAQEKLEVITDEYPVLLHVFFIKIAAQHTASINAADAQKLNKMHDTIVFHFQNGSPEEAIDTLEKASELASRYLNIADMGKIITDIKK
jgi:molecular chaperone DnaK